MAKVFKLNAFKIVSEEKLSKIVIAIDGTVSMSKPITQLKTILREALNTVKRILEENGK